MNSAISSFVKQGQNYTDIAASRARRASKRGIAAAGDAAQRALDSAVDASDSVFSYTKKSPAKALLIAAASGAALFALAKLLTPARD